jgi:RNA polymerase sigma factor (sigma-70 family)
MTPSQNVILIDDEADLLKALRRLLKAEGFQVTCHQSAADFLAAPRPSGPGCIVLDESMPGMTGMELQRELVAEGSSLAIIFLTARGDIPMSVRAMKAGAVDFLTKPVKDKNLISTIHTALKKSLDLQALKKERDNIRQRFETLTDREREVLQNVVKGLPNKQIAALLGLVEQTIKVHRSRVMAKMRADSLAQLVLLSERLGITGQQSEAI